MLQILDAEDAAGWMRALALAAQHDFYHLPDYHRLAQANGEGSPRLFVYTEAPYTICLPLLLRPLASVGGIERAGREWWDATSVYGYAGPVASHQAIPAAVLQRFHTGLYEALIDLRVVTVFSRLHCLIPQKALLAPLGEQIALGQTVSIDITLPPEQQRAQYRRRYKGDINRLYREGLECFCDAEKHYLGQFVEIYHETMRRVGAAPDYFFDLAYFTRLMSIAGASAQLFACLLDGQMICGGIFIACNGIVQYHLGATRDAYLPLSPMKLVFDAVRQWANAIGAHTFHLGGGVGSREDTLFHFKAGFSDRRHEFSIWKWVFLRDVYQRVCEEKTRWNERNGFESPAPTFFPQYRSPNTPLAVEHST